MKKQNKIFTSILPILVALFGIIYLSSFTSKNKNHFGIDISQHNGKIDWKKVQANNTLLFVYIKATEGSTHIDNRYKYNLEGAKKAGYRVGSYHYFRMTSSAHAQYKNFINTVDKYHQDLIPMIDVETSDGHMTSEVRDSLNVFIKLLKTHFGKAPMIYGTNRSYNQICGKAYNKYHLYIGRYGKNEPTISGTGTYTIWQYSKTGKIPGIPKPVDLARFNSKYSIKDIAL